MKFEKLMMAFVAICLTANFAIAQEFLKPVEGFSTSKTTYITLQDGKELEGTLRWAKRKKGLFSDISMKIDGEKIKVPVEDIKYMYLPQSGWDKMAKASEIAWSPREWGDDEVELNSDLIKDGYAYFETTEVQFKKKKITSLMQLLNPSFENVVRVYHDPWAGETTSIGVGGFKLAGGDDKSYYVKVGTKPAFKLQRKNYEDKAKMLFGTCKAVKGLTDRWRNFTEAVLKASAECGA